MDPICPICLEEDNQHKFSLPCNHSFHTHCITKCVIANHWNSQDKQLKKEKNPYYLFKCPYCRQVPHFNLEDEAKITTNTLTRVQQVFLRNYFNQRMLDNINLFSNLNVLPKDKSKFITNIFRNNRITLRCIQNMFIYGSLVKN